MSTDPSRLHEDWDPSPTYVPSDSANQPPPRSALPSAKVKRRKQTRLRPTIRIGRALASIGKSAVGSFVMLSMVSMIAMVLYFYWSIPAAALRAWPVYLLMLAPAFLVALAGRHFHTSATVGSRPLPQTAFEWLRARLRAGPPGISLARLEGRSVGSFYHPTSQTIVLGDDVRNSSLARAHSTAAHELGHALWVRRHPGIARVLLQCRRFNSSVFTVAMSFLFAIALSGQRSWLPLVAAAIAAAVAMAAIMLVEEFLASRIALQELRANHLDGDQLRSARRHLARAWGTYAMATIGYALPLLLWSQLSNFIGDGLLVIGDPPSRLEAGIVEISALLSLLSILATLPQALAHVRNRPIHRYWKLAIIPTAMASSLTCVLLCDQPLAQAAPWALTLAIVATFQQMTLPLTALLTLFAGLLTGHPPACHAKEACPPPATIPIQSVQSPDRWLNALRWVLVAALSLPLTALQLGWISP